MYKIGYGYDVHQLVENRKLVLGGVTIPYHLGLLGHSDADVLLHSIIDALLGSLALGDIGSLFPDNDNTYKDIDSLLLLKNTYELVINKGWILVNLDITICAQKPKLNPYILDMRFNIAKTLNTSIENISVKATTEEKMGYTGDGTGISSTAVVLLEKK